jgi:hypothetical protein
MLSISGTNGTFSQKEAGASAISLVPPVSALE